MKLVIRAFALSLVLVGAVAANSMPKSAPVPKSHQVTNAGLPVPVCDPDDPNACGIGQISR